MDHRQLVRFLAVGRVVVGAAFMIAPGLAGGGWVGEHAKHPGVKVALRAFGVRDLVLGLGTLRALDRGEDPVPWVQYGIAADSVDALATLIGFRHLPRGRRLVVLSAAIIALATGAATVEHLD